MLQHDATRAPMLRLIRAGRFAKAQGKAGRQLFGLGEIGFGTGGQRPTGQRRDALIGGHALALVDHDREIAFADLLKRGVIGQPVRIIAGIGADARRLAFLLGAVVIGRDHPNGTFGLHLQRQFPTQLDRLADQCGQQRHLGHQRFDLRRIVVLFQDAFQHAIKPRHAAAHVDIIKLKGQNGIVPRDFSSLGHRVSLSGAAWHTASI